ncbi:hypothetical protein ACH6EH_05300 [Paenibacillus sp. JSM ZJ436]|nr:MULTISPECIES: hypothetical protein [Paenibacillus]
MERPASAPQSGNEMSAEEISSETRQQAESSAIRYLKDQYNLDVEITDAKLMPSTVADKVNLEGHVTGKPEQSFKISVNYNTQETSNFVLSPELKKAVEGK